MRFVRAGLVLTAILLSFVAGCGPPSRYSLLFSKLPDRSLAAHLQGQTVAANIYAFVLPETQVKQVRFYVDDTHARGTLTGIENDAPYDLLGGSNEKANPYDTRQLSDGTHTLTAVITSTTGDTDWLTESFTVANKSTTNRAIYWGTTIDGVPWDMSKLTSWEAAVGKKPSIVQFWLGWSEEGVLSPFQPQLLEKVRDHGSIPMITWLPQRMSQGTVQPNYRLARIIDGAYDDYLRQWATDAKKWGHPFFLRWAHEMNGNWFPWGEDANGNKRGEYVQAWRHIVDIFRSAGADNVTWVWCPNIDWAHSAWPTMQSLYPGDPYVDWTCIDGYNWGPYKGGWGSFNDVFRWSYENLRSFVPNKPVMLGEFASAEEGGSKAAWITDAYATEIPYDYTGLHAVVWYNFLTDRDWRVESSDSSLAAFKKAIASPYYNTNAYADLTTSPIPPLK